MHYHSALISRLDHQLPSRRTGQSAHADALILTSVLAVALVVFVPVFTMFINWLLLPLPLPALVTTAGILTGYIAIIALIRRPIVGTLAALCVLSTFAADVPLGIISEGMRGTSDTSVWLFELPLIAGLGIAAFERWDRNTTFSRIHWLFIGFVAWAFLAALFGAGPRPLVAATYAFHFFVGFVVFAFVAAALVRGVFDLRTIVGMITITVGAQALFALVQVVHGRPFGFSRLGETGRLLFRTVTFGPLELIGGVYFSGFAGATHALIALCLLVSPLTLAYAIFSQGHRIARAATGVATIGLFVLVVLSTKSSARGAALLTLIAIIGLGAWTVWRDVSAFTNVRRRLVAAAFAIGASLVILVSPSQRSGGQLNVPDRTSAADNSASGTGSVNAGGASSGVGDSGAQEASSTGSTLLKSIEGAQIPLFDLGSLGIRAQQYITAIDVALTYPLFGLGGANFPHVGVTWYGLRPAQGATGPISNPVHNAYLSALASTGIPGFVLLCATLAAIVWAALSLVRHQTVELWVGVGVVCALLAYLAFIFWDITFISSIPGTIPFWILAGAVVGTRQRQYEEADANP